MAQGRKKRPEDLPWFVRIVRKEVADLLSVHPPQITHWINNNEFPFDEIQTRYDLREIVQWYVSHQAPKLGAGQQRTTIQDLQVVEMRQKIRKEEQRYAAECSELVPRRFVEQAFREMGVVLSAAGESLRKHYGDDAQQIVNDAIDAFERNMDGFYAELNQPMPSDVKPPARKAKKKPTRKAKKKTAKKKTAKKRKN